MDRSHARVAAANRIVARLLAAVVLVAHSGCALILATGIYVIDGGNMAPNLKGSRVIASSSCVSHRRRTSIDTPALSCAIAAGVSELLVKHIKDIDVVNPREVDNWVNESDWGDFRELAQAVHADKVVHIELADFELYKGKTLYQGRADVTVTVYDMKDHGKILWDKHLGEVLYPVNSGIPAQDKPVQQFEREFVEIVAERVGTNFYRYDRNQAFAIDAMANR